MAGVVEVQTEWSARILGHAGEGSSAEVLQVAPATGPRLALKIGRTRAMASVLAAEAEAAVHLEHAGTPRLRRCGWVATAGGEVRFVEPGADGARPALLLDWVEGRRLDATSLEDLDALAIVADVAATLGAIHAAGWAHGDVSLANLVLGDERAHLVDLGLAGPAGGGAPRGGTLRYLDPAGDARTRDLCALGAVIAELAVPALRGEPALLDAARRWAESGSGDLAAIAMPLLTPAPTSRPQASWAAERAAAAIAGRAGVGRRPPRGHADEVRSAYLRVRLGGGAVGAPGPDQPRWLGRLVSLLAAARTLGGAVAETPPPLAPLDEVGVSRWLVAMVGPAAVDWPVDGLVRQPEARLEEALVQLAAVTPPSSWTFDAVERCVLGGPPRDGEAESPTPVDDPTDRVARLALALAATPVDERALHTVEREQVPQASVLAAVEALRLRGEAGRARALLLRCTGTEADALAAEVYRRAGDRRSAERAAREAIAAGDPTRRGRAVLARLALDDGDPSAALRIASPPDRASLLEVVILAAAATGDLEEARAAAARGRALARTAEERGRLAGAIAYALADAAADEAHEAFREAAEHATRAGAVEEEATYRTGEAATAVSEGHLAAAVITGTRAALLWEARARPERAGRAMLACAAALATVGRVEECDRWAELAEERALAAGDVRAARFAQLTRLDARRGTDGERAWAEAVMARFGPGACEALDATSAPERGDAVRVLARMWGAGIELRDEHVAGADRAALDPTVDPSARLEWWAARAAREAGGPELPLEAALAAVTALVAVRAPVEARGRAAAAAFELAVARGRTDLAARLGDAARDAARLLVERAGTLADAARAVPWVARWTGRGDGTGPGGVDGIGQEQARELLRIVRSLEGRERLADLLDRIVDALVAWTGVERGLLLLPAPDGRLVPRAARHLGRGDLVGDQLALSQTLARRALDAGEPVVAVDASGEMADVHRSVHALRLRSVLAVPLVARGEVLGVVYLDDRVRRGAFGPRELAWARTVAALAATVLAEARERVLLRREARRARRAEARLAEELTLREAALEAATQRLAEAGERDAAFASIVGESPPLLRVIRTAERVARSAVPVLVTGESGTGKELFARALHEASPRARGPFVSENCSAIPATLLESTLFGHERGAFTGADRARAGLFEAADGGTLFLDEIGEMPLPMQAKLLRVLEDGQVRPVGGTRARRVDVRIVAATHRDLASMVAEQTFREDLLYRLNIVVLAIPPLRARRDDVSLLVRHFVARHAAGRTVRIARAAMDRLVGHDWPGNVRQVENEIRRALVLADDVIDVEHLTDAVAGRATATDGSDDTSLRGRIDALESALVREALEEHGGNVTHAARALGVSRFGLQKMVKRLGIERLTDAPPASSPRPKRARG